MSLLSSQQSVCVIIPAYNEGGSIATVIKSVKEYLPAADIVVMDDGSIDNTSQIANTEGTIVINLPFNLGIGGAVQTGLKYAHRNNYDIALEVDADGQHNPKFATALVSALNHKSQPDMVIGSRFISDNEYRSSILRRFGIHLFSYLIKSVTKKRIYDSTSGFRAYNKKAIAFLARRYPTDFPEPEAIVMLLNSGFRIKEVPVVMENRIAGDSVISSDISLKAAYFVISNAIAIVISNLKKKQYA